MSRTPNSRILHMKQRDVHIEQGEKTEIAHKMDLHVGPQYNGGES